MNAQRAHPWPSVALLAVVLAWAGLGCSSPAAALPSGDPADGVSIVNGIGSVRSIVPATQ